MTLVVPTAGHVGARGLARLEEAFGAGAALVVDEVVYVWSCSLCHDLTSGPYPRLAATAWWLCRAVLDPDLGASPYGTLSPEGARRASEAGVDLARDGWGFRHGPAAAPPGWRLWFDEAAGLHRFVDRFRVAAADLARLYGRDPLAV